MSMGMRMEMGMYQRLEQRQEMRLGMTMDQRMSILTEARMALVGAMNDERYDPHAVCPKCSRKLTLEDVLKGFTRDPEDVTTQCPNKRCKHRFQAALRNVSITGASEAHLPFFCPTQTLARLPAIAAWEPERIKKEEPAVHHSALVHFGSITNAFQRARITYSFVEVVRRDWREKVRPFLGKLPDTEIAHAMRTSASTVRRKRLRHKVQPFRWRDHVSAA